VAEVRCPKCGRQLIGGYYNPEELVKGPSDGVIATRVPVETALAMEDPGVYGLALYAQCEDFGRECDFREVFFKLYKKYREEKKAAKKAAKTAS